ncbi:MAG: hypothetical protein U9O94_01410 [Nanoarchaeota archaeon]|nr:hypothetical protein [Nanoarchaeota archaeon]
MAVPSHVAFASSADTTLIAAPGASNYLHIVGAAFHNNDNTAGNDVIVRLREDDGSGTILCGGSTGAIYLPARGGGWDVCMSYDHPYWDLAENKALYLDVSAARTVSGAVWYYTDTTATGSIDHATFNLTSNTSVISAVAGQTIKIVALTVMNNDSDSSDDEIVHLTDGNAGTDLYGTASGAIYLPGAGGQFNLPLSYANPWFELTTNTALYIDVDNSKRVSGAVWYIQD